MSKELPPVFKAERKTMGVNLEDGLHSGKITDVRRELTEQKSTGDEYDYTNIIILPDELEETISVGYPSHVTNLSGLGELAQRFKGSPIDFDGGEEINLIDLLVEQRCTFQTTTKQRIIDGQSVNVGVVIKDTVKPE